MSESPGSNEQAPVEAKKSPIDRWVKLGFLAVLLGAMVWITYHQLRGPSLGWPTDLNQALAQAKAENRRVVVFVRSFPIGEQDKWMIAGPLSKPGNREALEKGNFLLVELVLDKSADWAKRYGVTTTPTTLVIAPDGDSFHKQEGKIGELAFRQEFLEAPLTEKVRTD